ncbi:MAG: DNA-directed RNA polymerase subunit alpha [Dehalococcoidales bacterium]|nr:DNA-directed RNA polymerase subunit alpha [Dehalococcoidales bacterium]
MSRLSVPRIESVEVNDNYAHVLVEPLEKGFGITVGNAMRRVLLSYLTGAAITHVKIDGVQHELSTIPQVKEDVTEFLLNVKAIRLKSLTGQPGKLALEVEGEGQVTAADIKVSADYEIVNPELYLVTLDSAEAKLNVEFDVELGEGYRQSENSSNLPIGVIPVDALFTPVTKVNYTVEPVRVGRDTNRERLHLEVWTDGTMSPTDAVSRAAELIIEQIQPLVSYSKISQVVIEEGPARPSIPEELSNKPVDQLNLSVRTMNCLRRGGIVTVGELTVKSERDLLTLRNFGQKSLNEIRDKLAEMGLSLLESPQVEQEVMDET